VTDAARAEAAWASALQAVASYVAHDFRNALNGVAVNLEVVRGRSARGAEAAAIAPFAATAAAQFEVAAAAAESLLAFARSEPGDADVAAVIVRFSRLFSIRGDAAVEVTDRSSGQARTAVPAAVVRTAVARSVLPSLALGHKVACEIGVGDDIFLLVTGAAHVPPPPDPELVAVASAHGVRFVSRGRTLELRFPALQSRATATTTHLNEEAEDPHR
jgi:hypothetical protein